jgi:3-hydroxyisobutyrate dehydrogenase
MVSQVGFIGLGTMGEPMAAQLAKAGTDVLAHDVRAKHTARVAHEWHLTAANSAEAVFRQRQIVITMLPTSAHLERLLFGDGENTKGIEAALQRGTLLVDMSSGEPSMTRSIAQRLEVFGVSMVDSPVSGNVVRARKGDLSIMLGGAPVDCARAEPVLQPMARTIFRTGPLGSGQAMKALNNMASAAGFWIAGEILAVGKKAGLDPSVMLDVLNASTGSNNSTQNKYKPFVLSGNYQGNFLLQLMVKDLGIAVRLACEHQAVSPLATHTFELWQGALRELGDQADHTEVARWIAQKSGTLLHE